MNIASLIAAASPENGSKLFLQPSDDLLYSMDIQDINDLYAQTDLVFGSCCSELETERSEFSRTETTDSSGVSVRFARKQLMMYGYEQTSQAMWMLSNHIHRQVDREEFKAFDDLETTHAVKFRIRRCLPGGDSASLTQRITTRQFVEKDRVVIVLKSFTAGEGALRGIQTDETGWITIQPSSTGHGTTIELCLKQVPLHLNSPLPEPSAQQFYDMLQSVIQESNQEIFTAAEALLLEYAMTGINFLARLDRPSRILSHKRFSFS